MKETSIINHTISELIEILGDSDQGDGLHVHISQNRFEKIPISYPFRTDSYCLFLLVSGSLTLQLNLITHTLKKNEVMVAKPQVVAHIREMSPEISIISVSFTVDFILSNGFKKEDHDAFEFFTGNNIPKLKLSDEEMDSAVFLSKILERNQRFSLEKKPIKKSCYNLLLNYYYTIMLLFTKENSLI
ncbi:hypothetical protein RRF68_02925 [Tenacibaculum sp. HL-MS23]|uniref:hypothetical protein n=1 Tax=Tenacibaculum sp. HL-MS23 TaxID=3077734 RepID=UPI0028FC32E5|nr:hypothetical protein [Tenacibaculum sp. HL-MS23]WNW02393.1 hypothetical protein RRF68_02925 [Tenacibaculum sp. HL-MS23]